VAELASRLAGSSELFEPGGRRPTASVNYVTSHDGFTLADLVSYDHKHNEANGEDNRDGSDDNRSWNCGAEGPSDDPQIVALRARQQRNFLVTLLCSAGIPMLLAGDELGRTQRGNNNAYCQDKEISWLDWEPARRDPGLLEFARAVVALRREHAVFRRRSFFTGRPPAWRPGGLPDIVWLTPSAQEKDWGVADGDCLAVFLNADAVAAPEPGRTAGDESFLLLFNGGAEPVTFSLPDARFGAGWQVAADTAGTWDTTNAALSPGGKAEVTGRAVLVLRAVPSTATRNRGLV
jgi:glycogen operon protein